MDFIDRLRERILNIFTNRLTILWIVLLGMGIVLVYRCFSLQIVQGQEYLDNFVLEQEKTRDILAARGNIYDRNGELLAYDELAYSVKLEDTFESGKSKNEKLNALIYQVVKLIEKNGDSIDMDFKIYLDEDNSFQFSVEDNQKLRFLADVFDHVSISDLTDEERSYTALDVMKYLSRSSGKGYHYGIGAPEIDDDKDSTFIPGKSYTREEWLQLVTVRYAMSLTAYQKYIGTTIATDVSEETVAVIMENSTDLPGVSIEEGYVRRYVDSKYFSHVLGYTGKVSSSELSDLNERVMEETGNSGTYSISDVVGKSGIENYMEVTLQGTKGYEKVMVDNTGKVISVLERSEANAGADVYLTIDKDLTINIYNIMEQNLAGILSSRIINAKTWTMGENETNYNIKIPIYDVYFAVINNSIIDINHFSAQNASETEAEVYEEYLKYKANVYDYLSEEIQTKRTPYKKLKTEYQVYQSNIVQLLYKNGIIRSDDINTNDSTYIAWTIDESISMSEYIEYCIAMNWVDISKLDITDKYADSSQIFDAIVTFIFDCIDHNTEFQKKFYKYMLLGDKISGKQICIILYDQDAINIPTDEIIQLKKGKLTAFQFMLNRIQNLDITPAQLALDPCNASSIITDVNNGDVLAIVSYPGYDNNKMANSVDAEYYEQLTTDKSSPLLNFATQYKSAPGSTFKPLMSAAGLMEGLISLKTQICCTGTFSLIDPSPRCWVRTGHGVETVKTAIKDSCNVFFFDVGYRMATTTGVYNDKAGLATIYKYADLFGLTEKSGIEISEYSPDVSDSDSVRSAIGQGTHAYTVAGLARYVTAVATSGTVYDLTLLDSVKDSDGNVIEEYEPEIRNQIEMDEKYWKTIQEGMRMVVQNKSYFSGFGVAVAGKTGTAQQVTSRANHALFICYAPYDNPEIAMATRIPFGYSSDYAAQLSRDILSTYFGLTDAEEMISGQANTPDGGISNEN